jgi:hypothetical protein
MGGFGIIPWELVLSSLSALRMRVCIRTQACLHSMGAAPEIRVFAGAAGAGRRDAKF